MLNKLSLIEKIIQNPLEFTDKEFDILKTQDISFQDLRQMLIRIFDINETALKQESDATTGMMGFLNRWSTKKRQKNYFKKIKKGFRVKKEGNENNKLIVAEGDSWFQFPVFIKDIIDWLSMEKQYAIYSIAYGGDWFANILYEEKYIEELSIHRPDVFLISGCGNDFVGSSRIAMMVDGKGECPLRNKEQLEQMLNDDDDASEIKEGYGFITEAFYSFIWTVKLQYWLLFHNLNKSNKYRHMKIITQGYDYVVPTYARRWKKWYRLQPFLNKMIGSGKWLKQPLMIKGISDFDISKKIMKALIFEVNYMFIRLTGEFPNVHHIDCRGTAKNFDSWFDELHLHSEGYERIAAAYKYCIDIPDPPKVIRVTEKKPGSVIIIPQKDFDTVKQSDNGTT